MNFNTSYNKIVTDENLMETVKHGSIGYPFHFYYDNLALFDFHCIEWHWHTELEFVYIESGTVTFWIGEKQFILAEGNGVFINSKILHRFYPPAEAVIPNFLCLPSFIAAEDSFIYQKYILPIISSALFFLIFDAEVPWQAEALSIIRQYKKFLLSAGKTRSSILISCGARLAPFDIRELRELMETDEMELDTLGDRKTALFVIISDTDDTFNFVVSILYTQLFNLLCDKADDEYGGRLPVHVRCLLDEFANIGQIPKFEKLIATIRSREISASIILQSQSQLKAIYKDNADTITGNCDTTLFLGGKEKTTLKEMSELLGKETIDSFNTSETRGRELSHGLNYQKLGKELMTQDEIAVMDGGKCILQVRGVRPFFSDKFDITKHPKYKYLSDADPKNAFDMEKHIKRRPAIVKPEEEFDYYEIDGEGLQEDTDHE